MRWSYFDAGRYYGDLYVVTAQERPVAVFALFRWFHPVVRAYVCATSLDNSQVVASRNGTGSLAAAYFGTQMETAAESRAAKQIPTKSPRPDAPHCSPLFGRSEWTVADQTTMKKLRLLPQPIYRYSADAADGAIFAFANGTTPAVLLCVEADLSPKTIGWRYGFARRWSYESRMKNEHEEIWMAPTVRPPTNSNAPYYLSVIPEENAAE